jgi:hypothetical protein
MFSGILTKYEAVNTEYGTDKNTTHSYGPVYDDIFLKYKSTTGNILEIGISGGFSLLAYADYFQNATIYGLDIQDICGPFVKMNSKIKLQFGDAKSDRVVSSYNNMLFDIIIEDALHEPEDQIRHFMDFHKFVKPGGTYIIEDVNQCFLDRVSSVLKPYAEYHDFSFEVIDLRNKKNRADDILLIFKKKN